MTKTKPKPKPKPKRKQQPALVNREGPEGKLVSLTEAGLVLVENMAATEGGHDRWGDALLQDWVGCTDGTPGRSWLNEGPGVDYHRLLNAAARKLNEPEEAEEEDLPF